MHWHWQRFEELGVHRLYAALALRCRVFILEQGAYQDPDGLDQQSWHLLGYAAGSTALGEQNLPATPLIAYLRVVDPGVKYTEPSIGRVINAPEVRGQGMGRLLMAEGIRRCEAAWPGQGIRISAQAHLEHFYATLGFARVGPNYGEDNIPHLQMLRSAA